MWTIQLKDPRYSPWGLLTEEQAPRMIAWLTEDSSSAKVDPRDLSLGDLARIEKAKNLGIIEVKKPEEVESPRQHRPAIPLATQQQNTIFDASTLISKRMQEAEQKRNQWVNERLGVDKLLALPATKVKQELLEMADGPSEVFFFKKCRDEELAGKNRKTVLALLTNIITDKMSKVQDKTDVLNTNTPKYAENIYFDLIEEEEGEEVDIVMT